MLRLVLILSIFKLYTFSRLHITVHPESQIATLGSKIQFKCETEDQSSITWFFSQNSQYTQLVNTNNILIVNNVLTILSYNPDKHTGQYKCLINNTNLVVLSKPANLSQAKIDSFDPNLNDNQQINLSEGNVAIIPCKLPYSNPQAVPLFYLNDQLLPLGQTRYKIFPSGNLQISNIRQSDSGVYKCSAKNLITNEVKHSLKRITLRIFEPIGTKLPEIIYVPTDTNRVQIGSNLTLECVANGAPVPLVSWEKFGGILPEKRSIQVFGNLVLLNVQPEDKGTYVCRAENGPGQATFKTAMVDVFEAPTVIKSEEIVYTGKKSDIIDLKCPIKSRPRAEFQWFYNGQSLPTIGAYHKISFQGDKSVLSLRGNNQPGIYQCLAQNEFGIAQADLVYNLDTVIDVPKRPQIIMGPQNTTIYEGQSVVLLCVTSETSMGNTQINWLQNDLIIEPTLMRRFEINQLLGNLRIVSVQKSDAGVYKCIASNEFGMSTAEAYVNVKSIDEDKKVKKLDQKLQTLYPIGSKPQIQQIGTDKILLKWNLLDSQMSIIDFDPQVAYFKVDYKTNKQQIPGVQPNTWLTIDEQIDPKKREYILTDLSLNEVYRFRITTFFVNGELNHSHQSSKFRLEQNWTTTKSTLTTSQVSAEFKLSQIQVQISQIWAISPTSLGLKWNVLADKSVSINKKINGFYIYYRKLGQNVNHEPIPLYNYTRINVPLIQDQVIDSYLIANLEESTQYEIKMTCFNLNGDLCSFSNPIYGLTLTPPPSPHLETTFRSTTNSHLQQQLIKSKQNEILFMILGAVLGVLTLLLIIFIIMCVMRNRQHKKLLAQLHNTSHKMTSSSCPTLIYEDSLRQNNKTNIGNLYIPGSNDSNSTNSQSMSTTTSSITTPPINEHILLLNGNTVSSNSFGNLPPPIPQVPPPINPGTMGRININMNPLNGYLEARNQNTNENFYHTLTQLGNLPDKNEMTYSEYNNATLNMRNLIIKQQQQQQMLMNTLKNLNLQAQYQMNENCKVRSPSIKRNASGSKKSKKGKTENYPQQQQQQANYYLLPNCLPTQQLIYNEVDLLNAALLNQNLAQGNLFMLNPQVSSFQPQQIISPVNNNLMDLFDKAQEEITNDLNANKNEQVYEQTEPIDHNEQEKEPMLSTHYATTEIDNRDETNQLL